MQHGGDLLCDLVQWLMDAGLIPANSRTTATLIDANQDTKPILWNACRFARRA